MKYCENCFDNLTTEVGKTLRIAHEVDPTDIVESCCEQCQTSGHDYLYEPVHEHEFTKTEINQALEACQNETCFDCPLCHLSGTKLDCITYLLNLVRKN